MWTNNHGQSFATKADAFEWLNETEDSDTLKLYCGGELRYTKSLGFGIYCHQLNYNSKDKLPVERYD